MGPQGISSQSIQPEVQTNAIDSSSSPNRLPLLVGVFLLFISVVIWAYYFGPQLSTQSQKITPITTSSIMKKNPSPSSRVGKIVAINRKDPDFSFQFPYPQYCQGCFGGLGGAPQGYQSGEIVNQASDYGMPFSQNWLIHHVTVRDGAEVVGSDFTIPTSNYFETLAKLDLNGTVQITDDISKKSFSFNRVGDRTIAGVTAHVYESNMTTGHGTQTKYAIFRKGDYLYSLAFEWASDDNAYIFDLITSSFQFSVRPESEIVPY